MDLETKKKGRCWNYY